MRSWIRAASLWALLACSAGAGAGEIRTWTAASGGFTIEAD